MKNILLVIIITMSFCFPVVCNQDTNYIITTATPQELNYHVVRVVDGDTIVIDYNGKYEKVRLLMIDAPESVHPNKSLNTTFGAMVSDYTKVYLEDKYVTLEFDKETKDRYGRLLAYVYCNGVFVNELLVTNGYAKVEIFEPNHKYKDVLMRAQKYAQGNKLGIWRM